MQNALLPGDATSQFTCNEASCSPLHALQTHDTRALSQASSGQQGAC